jgi:hypothetical protein
LIKDSRASERPPFYCGGAELSRRREATACFPIHSLGYWPGPLESDAYRALQPDDVFDLALRNRLHFDHTSETGTVFHMLSALGRHGLIGLTAVGNSREEAHSLYERTRDALDREAREA